MKNITVNTWELEHSEANNEIRLLINHANSDATLIRLNKTNVATFLDNLAIAEQNKVTVVGQGMVARHYTSGLENDMLEEDWNGPHYQLHHSNLSAHYKGKTGAVNLYMDNETRLDLEVELLDMGDVIIEMF